MTANNISKTFLTLLLVAGAISFFSTPSAEAHRSGCHRWHSCPSDSGSYLCGDTGHPCQYPTYPVSGGAVYPPSGYYKDCYNCAIKKVPDNATVSGYTFTCNWGYYKYGNSCIASVVPENSLLRLRGGATVYQIINGKKTPYISVASFLANGNRWSDIHDVDVSTLAAYPESTSIVSFPVGTLIRSFSLPYVWRINQGTDGIVRKWVTSSTNFESCGFNWNSITTIPENEVQAYYWEGNNSLGNIEYPLCN